MINVVVHADGSGGHVELPDETVPLAPGNPADVQQRAVSVLLRHSAKEGRPVTVKAVDASGARHLRVTPDGRVEPLRNLDTPPVPDPAPEQDDNPAPPSRDESPAPDVDAAPAAPAPDPTPTLGSGDELASAVEPGPPGSAAAEPMTRRARKSFLTVAQAEQPAMKGLRGAMTRAGIRMAPSEAERLERADVRAVSQHWPGPRTIAVVNGKGGASKTPTTVLLSAVFALNGGAGVVAYDNNQTRGTLGWRTEQGPHEATLLDMLPRATHLLGTGAQSADLAHYVHHQTQDRYDVLRSQPMMLADQQRLGVDDFDAVHAVLKKYYRLIFVDSGNDESDPLWLRMIDHADQLVVATTTRADIAEAGALLLEALADRDERSAALAAGAVVVVNQANEKGGQHEADQIADGYRTIAREAVTIPYDKAMVDGHLQFSSLRPTTRRAWLTAGAAVARGL